jgi:leucyl aminopeptidase (aminopeptidase T)
MVNQQLKAWEAAKNALENVLDAVAGESLVIICDEEKSEIGHAFAEGALALGLWTRLMILEAGKETRKEIPPQLREVLTQQKPNIFINLMHGQRDETPFRIEITKLETRDRRSRLGHCPGVTLDMLTDGALSLTSEGHQQMQSFAQRLLRTLEGVFKIELHTPSGTRLSLSTEKRQFYTDTKLDWKTMKWMNLPTGEVLAAPVEDSLSGRLICDMAIGGIGPLKTPVDITVKSGQVVRTTSKNKAVLKAVKESLTTDEWSNIVGEFAFGINPKARFVQEFLEAEKIIGTVHIAFGDNLDYPGGRNPSKNHMDFLMNHPTVKITKENGESATILQDGSFQHSARK